MIRVVHSQTGQGALLIDDVDDGLPNKTAKRLSGDPKAMPLDGASKAPKQKCYVPRVKAAEPAIPGYVDLNETARVLRSAAGGKIAGLVAAGKATVVSLVASDLATPVVSLANLDAPGAGDLTITGTGLLSVSPDITRVVLTGTGAVTLTQTQITTGGGTLSNTSIVIPAALVPGVANAATSARITADGRNSNVLALS